MKKQNLLKRATIRNSRVCDEVESYGHYTSFDIERDKKGWDFPQNATLCGVSSGFLFMSATTESPSISRSTSFSPVDAGTYTEVVVRYKYKKNSYGSIADRGKIQFTTQADSTFTEDKEIEFDIISDDEWHVVYVNMGELKEWAGNVNNLKIFLAINGRKDDEIFISYIKIQKNIFNFCTEGCYINSTVTEAFSNFDSESLGSPSSGYSYSNIGSFRTADIILDPLNSANQVMTLNNTAGVLVGPTSTKVLTEDVADGFFSCRFMVTHLQGRVELLTEQAGSPAIDLIVGSNGKLKYKSGSSYVEFTVDHNIEINKWYSLLVTFNFTELLFTVSLGPTLLGTVLPYNVAGTIKAIRFENEGNSIGDLLIDDVILVQQTEDSINCPGIGKQGEITGAPIQFNHITISKNINDSVIININGFGDVIVRLPEATAIDPYELRNILERQICLLDVGGYPYSEVLYVEGSYKIRSGTYGFDSSVKVSKHGNSNLAESLGFVLSGNEVGISENGRPHSGNFKFSNTFKATTLDLNNFKDDFDSTTESYHNPQDQSVELGSKFAGKTSRKNILNGQNKTFIDYYHRATSEGRVTELWFHGKLPTSPGTKITGTQGQAIRNLFITNYFNIQDAGVEPGDVLVIDEPGYLGNGSYVIEEVNENLILKNQSDLPPATNLNFSVHNIPKVKQFRPRKDGSLFLVNEAVLGLEVDNKLYTRSHDTYSIEIDWYVYRGDLIGIYNAISIYTGNDPNGSPDALYVEKDGDLVDDYIEVTELKGQGIKGIGLYAFNPVKQNRAVYDIEFNNAQSIEYIDISGIQIRKKLEYNLTTAIGSGFSLSAVVDGYHTHNLLNNSTGLGETVEHPNIGYNIHALTDGVKYASNGLLDQFEENSTDATYFYISGDGEFAGYDGGDSLEFPENGIYRHLSISEYSYDAFEILSSWSVNKEIYKYRIYFKDYPNVDGFYLEYLRPDGRDSDGSKPGFERIGQGGSYEFTKVSLDNLVLLSDILPEDDAFNRHFEKTFVGYVGITNPGDGAVVQAFRANPYTVLEKEFTPVTTTSINWNCQYHSSTKIAEIEVLSTTDSSIKLEEVLELYFSIDGDTFQRVTGESINDDTVRFRIGFPTAKLRLIVEPTQPIYLNNILATSSDDLIRYKDGDTEKSINSADITGIEKGNFSDITHIQIKNGTGESADLELSVDTEELSEDILVKSSLNTKEEVVNPEIGPSAFIVQDEDFKLRTVDNVAINVECFGLSNLAANKKYYISESFDDESDYFLKHIDINKWIKQYTNFPQPFPADNIGEVFPGFTMAPVFTSTGGVTQPATAELQSRWRILGEFNASAVCVYDARGGNASPMGSRIGIVDSTGRSIYIKKDRTLYFGSLAGIHDHAYYYIDDSLSGILASKSIFNHTTVPHEGDTDDGIEYVLNVSRVLGDGYDVLRFSYIDETNGSGVSEWNGSEYFEVDLLNLSTPLVGDLRIFIRNYWDNSHVSATGTPDSEGTRVGVVRFGFGGNTSYVGKFHQTGSHQVLSPLGQASVDNKITSLNSNTGVKYVAVDLERRYFLDIIYNYTNSGKDLWNKNFIQYSNSNTENVEEVEWGNSDRLDARWLLFSQPTVPYDSTSGIVYLDTIKVYPEITKKPPNELYNSEWESLGNVLGDGDNGTSLNQVDYPVISIKLENQFDIVNFQLLDEKGKEQSRGSQDDFLGWYGRSEFTRSFNITDSPVVVDWDPWKVYIEENKNNKPTKWYSFRNRNFNTNGGGVKYLASELIATTRGIRDDNIGEAVDMVDFTEYSAWYGVDYKLDINIAKLDFENMNLEGTIYGSSVLRKELAGVGYSTMGMARYCFDDNSTTNANFLFLPAHLWRVFGSVEVQSVSTPETTISGDNGLVVISGASEYVYTVNYSEEEIEGFEVVIPEEASGIPNTIEIQNLTGSDPTKDSSWTTIYTEDGLVTDVILDGGEVEKGFNNGEAYLVKFDEPLTSSGLRLVVTDAEYLELPEETITIEEFRIFKKEEQTSNPLITLTNDELVRNGGRRSLKINYPKGYQGNVKVTAGGNFSIEPDGKWSVQDFLSFYLKIDNPNLLDLSNCSIRIGKSSEDYYEWSFKHIEDDINSEVLTKHTLRFLEADDKGEGEYDFAHPDRLDLYSKVDFINGPLEFFEIELSPKTITSSDINIWLDNFQITRENFTLLGKYNNTLYLNNSELIYYPITGFDIRKGFFEAIITPDWDLNATLTPKKVEVFTIFSIVNGNNESFSFFYDARLGLVFVISTDTTKTTLEVGKFIKDIRYKPVKLSVAWDSEGNDIDARSNSNLRLWIDDIVIGDFITKWEIEKTKDIYFFVGSRAYQSDVAISTLTNYPTTIPIKIVPKTNSLTGGIENLILSSTPKKVNFEDLKILRDKIYLSIDGVNFYKGSDPAFPFVFENIQPNEVVNAWIKLKLPEDTNNLSRTAFLRSKWRIRQ